MSYACSYTCLNGLWKKYIYIETRIVLKKIFEKEKIYINLI